MENTRVRKKIDSPSSKTDEIASSETESDSIIFSEKDGTYGKEILYVKPDDADVIVAISNSHSWRSIIQDGFKRLFVEVFLPQGYPASVSKDYTSYQIWDTVQAFCSTITGILATQSVMKGVGVGDVEATPLAATITWVIKDGTGHMGRIAFAWWKGTSLDADSKMWRLMADGLNDAAICLELALPLFSGYTTYVLCLSTAMKAIVGVAGGATRAALTQHQAIRGNMADVSAKDGSQETAVNLIASCVAILILSHFEKYAWPIFFIFTALHLFANYRAVASVCLNTFNSSRFLRTVMVFLRNETILEPGVVNEKEPIFFFANNLTEQKFCGYKIYMGVSLRKHISRGEIPLQDLQAAILIYGDSSYMVLVNKRRNAFYVALEESARSEDVLCGYFHALVFAIILSSLKQRPLKISNHLNNKSGPEMGNFCNNIKMIYSKSVAEESTSIPVGLYEDVQVFVEERWQVLKKGLVSAGWNLERNLLTSSEWTAKWKNMISISRNHQKIS